MPALLGARRGPEPGPGSPPRINEEATHSIASPHSVKKAASGRLAGAGQARPRGAQIHEHRPERQSGRDQQQRLADLVDGYPEERELPEHHPEPNHSIRLKEVVTDLKYTIRQIRTVN